MFFFFFSPERYEFRSMRYFVSLRSQVLRLLDFCAISALGTPKPGHEEQNSDETE